MTLNRRYIRAAIGSLESEGWSINADGTITCVRLETKYPVYDQRAKKREPRYHINVGWKRNEKTYSMKPSDLVVAKFGRITTEFRFTTHGPKKVRQSRRAVAARERPDEAEVGLRLDLEPKTRTAPAA